MSGKQLNRRDLLKVAGGGALGAAALAGAGTALAAPAAPKGGPAIRTASNAVTITYMTWGSLVISKERDAAIHATYPELDRIKINHVVGGAGDLDVAKALRLALASGENIPEMVQLNVTEMPEFAQAGELLDLGQMFTPVKSDLYAGASAIAQYNGKFVAVPYQLKSKLFFYRTDLLAQAGIDPTTIKTVTDLLNAGKTLHEKVSKTYLLNMDSQPQQYWMGEVLSAYPNVHFADQAGNYQITTNKAFADMFNFTKQIKDSGIALPVDDFSTDWQAAFAREAISGVLIANWMKEFIPKFAPKQAGKWKAMLWPPLSPLADQRYGSDAGGSIVVLPKRAKNSQAAMEYLSKMFLSTKGSLAIFSATGETPLLKSAKDEMLGDMHNAKKPASMSETEWNAQPQVYFGADYYDTELGSYDYVKVLPYDPSSAKEIPILLQWLEKYIGGKSTLDAALAGAQNDMKSQIGNPYKG